MHALLALWKGCTIDPRTMQLVDVSKYNNFMYKRTAVTFDSFEVGVHSQCKCCYTRTVSDLSTSFHTLEFKLVNQRETRFIVTTGPSLERWIVWYLTSYRSYRIWAFRSDTRVHSRRGGVSANKSSANPGGYLQAFPWAASASCAIARIFFTSSGVNFSLRAPKFSSKF